MEPVTSRGPSFLRRTMDGPWSVLHNSRPHEPMRVFWVAVGTNYLLPDPSPASKRDSYTERREKCLTGTLVEACMTLSV